MRENASIFMFKSSGLFGVDVCGGLLSFVEKQCVSRILEIICGVEPILNSLICAGLFC